MNPILFSLWLLITPATDTHPPVVIERFPDFQKCEEFRKAVESISRETPGNKTTLKCERATIAR